MHTGPRPGHSHQHATGLSTHDGHVMQGLTEGHIVVKGHEEQDEDLQAAKEMEGKDLDYALTEVTVAFFRRVSAIVLGAMEVEKQVSHKDEWKGKKCIDSQVSGRP